MTAEDLINILGQIEDKTKEVQIFGQCEDGSFADSRGNAVSRNDVGNVEELDDCVGIGRVIW